MKSKHNLIKLILILYISLKSVNAQPMPPGMNPPSNSEKCKEKGERGHPRQYEDCKSENDENNVCCFLTGTYFGEKYEGCIAMDMEIYGNRSVKYEFNSISATLVCQDNYNFDKFINNRYFFYFNLFLFVVLL